MNNTTTDALANLIADGPIAAVHFHTTAASRNTRAFGAELATALSAAPQKPLVITGDTAMTALFRFYQRAELKDSMGRALRLGLRFADLGTYTGAVHIETQVGTPEGGTITLPDGGRWSAGLTPDNTLRHALPVFDSQRVSRAVETMLGQWTSAGKLVEIEQPLPAYTPSPTEPTRIDRFTPGERAALALIGIE